MSFSIKPINKYAERKSLYKALERYVKKYNPSTRKHEFFVEKKLPPHSK